MAYVQLDGSDGTHSHQHVMHLTTATPAGPSSTFTAGQPIIINLGTLEMDGGLGQQGGDIPPAPGLGNAQPGAVGGAASLPSIRSLLKPLEGSLPFILLIFIKVMYEHRLGILVFGAMFGTMFHANSSLRRLVAQRETQQSSESTTGLLWLVVFLSANIFFVYYVFEEQQLYRSLYFTCPEVDLSSVWILLWVTGTNDFIVKFSTVAIKSLVALVPRHLLNNKRKGKWYMVLEALSQTYRSLIPITPWLFFLYDVSRLWFSVITLVIYVLAKGSHLFGILKQLRLTFAKFRVDSMYGTLPSRSQIESCDNLCPICHDKLSNPVALSCMHVFCEECVATWFNRERTCPMCRANIVEMPQWRDGTTSTSLQIY